MADINTFDDICANIKSEEQLKYYVQIVWSLCRQKKFIKVEDNKRACDLSLEKLKSDVSLAFEQKYGKNSEIDSIFNVIITTAWTLSYNICTKETRYQWKNLNK